MTNSTSTNEFDNRKGEILERNFKSEIMPNWCGMWVEIKITLFYNKTNISKEVNYDSTRKPVIPNFFRFKSIYE